MNEYIVFEQKKLRVYYQRMNISLKEYFPVAVSVDAIAGFTAGAVTTCIVHPLDLLKVRLQGTSMFSHFIYCSN
jgi:hypothetical protein